MKKPVQEFDQTQLHALKKHLGTEDRSKGMSYSQCAGFLFVVACAPELINPSEWLTIVLDDSDLDRDNQQTLDGLMSLYNEINRQVQAEEVTLPPGCEFTDNPTDNFNANMPIKQWSTGFVMGYSWLSKMWSEYLPAQLTEEMTSYQMALGCFADKNSAQLFVDNIKNKDVTLEKIATDMQSIFPDAMKGFAHLGRTIQQVLMEREKAVREQGNPQQAVSTKVGRNDACPCGSGKKYKKCCGPN